MKITMKMKEVKAMRNLVKEIVKVSMPEIEGKVLSVDGIFDFIKNSENGELNMMMYSVRISKKLEFEIEADPKFIVAYLDLHAKYATNIAQLVISASSIAKMFGTDINDLIDPWVQKEVSNLNAKFENLAKEKERNDMIDSLHNAEDVINNLKMQNEVKDDYITKLEHEKAEAAAKKRAARARRKAKKNSSNNTIDFREVY